MLQPLGNINSIETSSSIDGPGIRYVINMQGCPMRCLYCHKPDSWNFNLNKKMNADDVIADYQKNIQYLKSSGITVSGGEPLVQADFVAELFKKAKSLNIHTVLETSGVLFDKANTAKIDKVIENVDLILLDIKHIDPVEHNKITGHPNSQILDFARYLSDKKIPVWIRYVVVPTITNNKTHLIKLGEFLSTLKNIEALDVLPYSNITASIYERLAKPYPLKALPSVTKAEAMEAKQIIIEGMKSAKS